MRHARGPIDSVVALWKRAGRGLPDVGCTPHDIAWRENKWRLLRFRGAPRYRTPIVIVPSLINRYYVLDLQPGRSLCEWLVARGHDVYVIDWGTPTDEDRFVTWDDVCDRAIGRALRRAGGGGPVHVLGYCLGGTLAAVHAAARPERVATLALIAAPIDFASAGIMAAWTRTPTFDVGALVDAFGNVPWPLMQASFHALRPTGIAQKLVTVIDRAWDDEFLDGFLATERWGNDNVSFPGACYREYIERLYRDNELVRGTMTLAGRPARLADVDCPLLVVSFANDHIVPPASATAALDLVGSPDKAHVQLAGGHVGAVVSRKAATGLWPQLSQWWSERDSDEARGL
jgi:polyhydroxyalkanoate synthase